MKKNTTLLFVDRETISLVRFKNYLIDDMNLNNVVSLDGWGIKKLSDIDYRDNDNSIQFYNADAKFRIGTLIICEPYRYYIFDRDIFSFIERNKDSIEKIICNWNSQGKFLEEFCTKNKIEFYQNYYDKVNVKVTNKVLYQIRVPIVYITSISEMSDKFVCQMKMRSYFEEKGYNVQLIGSKSYSNLLGVRTFPSFMFENNLTNTEKIIAFNHYLKIIEDTDNPDLIIVGIPGEIKEFINETSKHFDDMQYLVSNAAKPDITVLCGLYEDVLDIEHLLNTLDYKYDWKLDGVCINNLLLDLQLSQVYGKKEYVKIENEVVDQKIMESNKICTMFYSFDNLVQLFKNIEDKLINFGNENLI